MSSLLRALSSINIKSTIKAPPAPVISQDTRKFTDDYLFNARWPIQFHEDDFYGIEQVWKSYPKWKHFGDRRYGSGLNREMQDSPLTLKLPKEGSDLQTMTRFYQGTVCRMLIADFTAQVKKMEAELPIEGTAVNGAILDQAATIDSLAMTVLELDRMVEHFRGPSPVAKQVSESAMVMTDAQGISDAKTASAPMQAEGKSP